MANRQDSGGDSAHQKQGPTPHSDDAVPEMMDDDLRGRADEEEDVEFDDSAVEDEESEEDEGRY